MSYVEALKRFSKWKILRTYTPATCLYPTNNLKLYNTLCEHCFSFLICIYLGENIRKHTWSEAKIIIILRMKFGSFSFDKTAEPLMRRHCAFEWMWTNILKRFKKFNVRTTTTHMCYFLNLIRFQLKPLSISCKQSF